MNAKYWTTVALMGLFTLGAFANAGLAARALLDASGRPAHPPSALSPRPGAARATAAGMPPMLGPPGATPLARPALPAPTVPSPGVSPPTVAADSVAAPSSAPAPRDAEPRPSSASAPAKPAQPAIKKGQLNFRASDVAEVYVDGKRIGRTPVVAHVLSAGIHAVRFDCVLEDGKKAKGAEQPIQVVPDTTQNVDFDCPEANDEGSESASGTAD